MYYGSPYETSSDCGNCDGARCHRCRELWDTEDGETFDSYPEALAHEEKLKKSREDN